MSTLRLLSAAARRTPSASVLAQQWRGYAEAAGKINLSLVLPHQVRRTTQNYLLLHSFVPSRPSLLQQMLSK